MAGQPPGQIPIYRKSLNISPQLDTRTALYDSRGPVAACYFDVDGTLVSTNLVHPTLYYLVKDKGTSHRTVRALTWRVVFSIALFVLLMLSFHFGFVTTKL